MTTPAQPNPNPLPAILVYGTPGSPELTQASWFRAEDKEAAKAAAAELKFSVIELQTDAEKALATGAHEGVLKGSGRMIVGSVSAEVYRRIQEHVGKGASALDPSQPEIAAARATKPASEQSMNISVADAISPGPAPASLATPAIDKPDSTTARETLRVGTRVLAAYWNEKRVRGLLGRDGQADRTRRVHPRMVRRAGISALQEPAAGHRRAASGVPRLGQVTRGKTSSQTPGAACGSPLLIRRMPMSQARAIPTPTSREQSHD
jgi:hypothetical protein